MSAAPKTLVFTPALPPRMKFCHNTAGVRKQEMPVEMKEAYRTGYDTVFLCPPVYIFKCLNTEPEHREKTIPKH